MRRTVVLAVLLVISSTASAQTVRRFPPDSLINTRVIPRNTPPTRVIGQMRDFTFALGVRCSHCHVGEEGRPLGEFDFASDQKRPKLVAREMMKMVAEINRRLDTLPDRGAGGLAVTCNTCHRGVTRPVPLSTLIADAGAAGGADSAIRAYRALRTRYHGADSYDFSESSLNIAAFRLARANRPDDGLALLALNEEFFPGSSALSVFRGNIHLMRGDTTAAAGAFQEAVRRDPSNAEARGRLRDIGRQP